MKKAITFTPRLMLGIVFFMSLLFFGISFYLTYQIKKNIKSQIKEEIRQGLSKEIRQSVIRELASYTIAERNYAQKQKAGKGIKDAAGGEIRRQIREAVRAELDSYVASGSDSESPIAGGFMKKQGGRQKELASSDKTEAQEHFQARGEEELSGESDIFAGREKSIERTLVQKGGMLLPKGKLQIEPGFTFAHFSSNRINIQGFSILPILVIGEISTETVKRDILIQSLSLKYGILHNLQGEVKIPYRFEYDRVTDNLGFESTRKYGGLGDIDFSLSRQIGYEKGIIPDLIASLSVKTRTGKSPYNRDIGLGTGHWGVKGSLIAAKSSDPAVVFGSLSYAWNIERDIENFGKVDPGDTIGYSVGTAIALSYQTAINFQFEHSITSKMEKDGTPVNGSFLNAASLKSGFTWSTSGSSSVDFSVSMGLTTDAPDYVVEIRFPFTF